MPKPDKFKRWLYAHPLDRTAFRLGVTKTTIREWRTGRGRPNTLRHLAIIRAAREDGVDLRAHFPGQ